MRAPTAYECTLGFDAKINRQGRPFAIEINGKNSGIYGLEALEGGSLHGVRSESRSALTGELVNMSTQDIPRNQAIADGIVGPDFDKEKIIRLTFNHFIPDTVVSSIHGQEKNYQLKNEAVAMERLTVSKILQKKFIPREFQAPYARWNSSPNCISSFIETLRWHDGYLLDLEKYPYMVIKGDTGAHGDGVDIIHLKDAEKVADTLRERRAEGELLEGFIESKPIEGQEDACMRYLADFIAYCDEEGQSAWQSTFEGAYWRVPPGGETLNHRFRANRTGVYPAKEVAACPEDIKTVRMMVHQIINNIVADPDMFT